MAYIDAFFSREHRFALGTDSESRRNYASIPVSFGIADGEEYYEVTPEEYRRYLDDPDSAVSFIESCRRHEQDARLLKPPGWNRGTPV